MKAGEVTVEVKARMSVDRRTAEAGLKLAEMYASQEGFLIVAGKLPDGSLEYHFEREV